MEAMTMTMTMTETEALGIIRSITGISQQAGEQEATQPDSVIAENYARVVAEVMRRDGIELNGVDMRNIRTRVLELLAYRRRSQQRRRARKVLTSGRSRNDCGGNLLIFPITQNCVGWWVSCRFATRP